MEEAQAMAVVAPTRADQAAVDLDAAASLRFYVFGPPRLERDGAPIDLGLRRALALLALLGVSEQPQSRDALATLLWPDADQSEGRGRLRRTLHRLGQALGETLLVAGADTVALRPDAPLWLDSLAFARLAESALADDAMGTAQLAQLHAAAELYGDDFLAGFTLPDSPAFDEWQFFERERLRQLFARVLERLVAAHQARHEWAAAIDAARSLVALDPLHEPAQRQLMQLYAWSGQLSAAQRQYQACARLLEAELDAAPEPETTALLAAIRAKQLPPPTPAPGFPQAPTRDVTLTGAPAAAADTPVGQPEHTPQQQLSPPAHVSPRPLPTPLTPFVGRDREQAEVEQLLTAPNCRLLTLLGPGGMGKTRLALAVAAAAAGGFAQGVAFVSLAPLTNADQLVTAIADALGCRFYEAGDPQTQLIDYLRARELLLVLDNFEHLPDGTGLLLEILLAAPQVRALATSRSRLNLSGELVYVLGSLELPPPDAAEGVLDCGAAQLLLQYARLARPDLEVAAEDLADLARICRLVRGMPLALVLAASWAGLLSFAEIADEIARSVDFLESQAGDLPERQRSMRGAFDSSWQRLSPEEQRVFMGLSVFQGGFTRAAVQAVVGADMHTLRTLVHASLVTSGPDQRYDIHELLRQYALEQLEQTGGAPAARAAQSAYYLRLLCQAQEGGAVREGQQPARVPLAREIDNIRAAWRYAVDQGDRASIGGSLRCLYRFYWTSSRFREGEELFAAAVRRLRADGETPDERLLAQLQLRQASFLIALGRHEQARPLLDASLELARRHELCDEVAFALNVMAEAARVQGKPDRAMRLFRESLLVSRASRDRLGMARALKGLGWTAAEDQGDYLEARYFYRESLAIYRAAQLQAEVAAGLDKLGHLAWKLGAYDEAELHYRESLAIFEAQGDRLGRALAIGGLGLVAFSRSAAPQAEAERMLLESLAICRETGNAFEEANRLLMLGLLYNRGGSYLEASECAEQAHALARALDYGIGITAALSIQARAACEQGELAVSRRAVHAALRRSLGTAGAAPVAAHVLNSLAALLIAESACMPGAEAVEALERAAEIVGAVMAQPASWQLIREDAAGLARDLEAMLPPDLLAGALARGARRTLADALAAPAHGVDAWADAQATGAP
jgi:predicted ATPase/DNA-binding SARP family transcriptional activator